MEQKEVEAMSMAERDLIIDMGNIVFEGKEKAVGYVWNFPELDAQLPIAILILIAGFLAVWLIERKSK